MKSKASEYLPDTEEQAGPPCAPKAEQGVLGCVLWSPDKLDECAEAGVEPDWFYDLKHGEIFETLRGLWAEGKPLDLITVEQCLRDRGTLERLGGQAFLSALLDVVPSAANLSHYLDIVQDKFVQRQILQECTEAQARVRTWEGNPQAIISHMEGRIMELSQSVRQKPAQSALELVPQVVDRLEHYTRGSAQFTGQIITGLDYFDKLTLGLGGNNGNLWVISGRPGTGKTSFAMQVAFHVALDFEHWQESGEKKPDGTPAMVKSTGLPVGVFSMEMNATALMQRTLFQRAKVDMQTWRTGFADGGVQRNLITAAGRLAKARVYVDDESRMTIDTLRARARRMYRQQGCRLFIVDYIQLMRANRVGKRDDRVQELAEISAGLQALGKELNCPILVLAQMNRDYEKEVNRKPRLSDLKDCGAIEQDADGVVFLYSPKMNAEKEQEWDAQVSRVYGDSWSKHPRRVNALIAKNRYGPADKDCELVFHASYTAFEDFGEWQKENGLKQRAAGESNRVSAAELPTDEEMNLR
jgi:replicative DNA helicase